MAHTVTVGQLRAELVGLPDDLPVAVLVPDRSDPTSCAVLYVDQAGHGSPSDADADLLTGFALGVTWPTLDAP